MVAKVISGGPWQTELAYAQRGGFDVWTSPRLLKQVSSDHIQILFPTNASILQEGTLVAVAVIYECSSQQVTFAYHIGAGPDAEIQILRGETALGLPRPQPGSAGEAAMSAYRSWRRAAWIQFWLDELENGIERASAVWLDAFWAALEALLAGNDLRRSSVAVTRGGGGEN